MEFSDDSFIWSNASNDSDNMELDIKQEQDQEDSDNTIELNHQEKSEDDLLEHKKKAKKRKHEEPKEVNGTVQHKPKSIKSETDSEIDTPRKKKKKKHRNHDEDIQESDHDYSFLNYKVKQEQASFLEPAPIKSKNQKKQNKNSESFTTEDLENTSLEIGADENPESLEIDSKLNVKEEVSEKKKKKKSKKDTSNNTTLSDDIETSDDNFQSKKKIKKKKRDKETNRTSFDNSNNTQVEEISCIDSSTLHNNFIEDEQIKDKSDGAINNESTITESNSNNLVNSKAEPAKQTSKILDRLRFEDEDTIDPKPKVNDEETNLSKRLRKFFDANKKLLIISPNAQTSLITEDDDVWIINTPHELSVKDFKGINIKVDTKCKLKFNGQSYDSVIDNCIKKTPIMSHLENKLIVKNVPIINSINVRKRIPKTHIPEENVIINNQMSFIPLPETKFRHPLFGINYKQATKIPISISERLNNTITETSNSDKGKRKKHKKEKRKVEIETEFETKPLTETDPMVSEKKKRKRKSSTKDEHIAKKAKYIKNEPESTDVWDSEQAIEKNLFDF